MARPVAAPLIFDEPGHAPRPLRVCHVSLTLKTGGLERILADIARHQTSACPPTFVAMNQIGRFAEEIRATGCEVHQLPPRGRLGQVRELARFLRERRIDVVHTHNTYPHLYASLAARWAGVPVVVQTRHGQRAGHGWKSRVLYRWASRLVDRIVAVSDDAAHLCVEADGIPPSKVQRIWNGIDLSAFEFHGPAATPTAISVARLSPEKDFPTLLRAVAVASESQPELRLKVVGDGPERESLVGLCQQLGLRDRVEWLGERRDVASLLKSAGFFVTSSRTEGISLTLLEAMAVGLPVVATAAGGNGEIVVQGETGLLVPVGDARQLSAAIVAMCQRSPDWCEMGQAGRDRVVEHFDVRRMVAEYEALYAALWEQHQRGAGRATRTEPALSH